MGQTRTARKILKKYREYEMNDLEEMLNKDKIKTSMVFGDVTIDMAPYIAVFVGIMGEGHMKNEIAKRLEKELGAEHMVGKKSLKMIDGDFRTVVLCPVNSAYLHYRLLVLAALRLGNGCKSMAIYLLQTIMGNEMVSGAVDKYNNVRSFAVNVALVTAWCKQNGIGMDDKLQKTVEEDALENVRKHVEGSNDWEEFLRNEIGLEELVRRESAGEEIEESKKYSHITKEVILTLRTSLGDDGSISEDAARFTAKLVQETSAGCLGELSVSMAEFMAGAIYDETRVKDDINREKANEQRIEMVSKERDKLKEERQKAVNELREAKKSVEKAERRLREIEIENAELAENINNGYVHNKITELENELKKSRIETAIVSEANSRINSDNSILRREVKRMQREIGKLNRRDIKEQKDEAGDNYVEEMEVEEMAEFIRDFRIFAVGGHESLQISLDKYEMTNIKFYGAETNPEVSGIKNCDYVVIITNFISHSKAAKVKNYCRKKGIKVMHFNGNNIENLIKSIYEEVTKDSGKQVVGCGT